MAISQLYFIIFESGLRFWVLGRWHTVKTLLNKISNGKKQEKVKEKETCLLLWNFWSYLILHLKEQYRVLYWWNNTNTQLSAAWQYVTT